MLAREPDWCHLKISDLDPVFDLTHSQHFSLFSSKIFSSHLSSLSFIMLHIQLFEVSKMINVHGTLWKHSLVFLQFAVSYMRKRSNEEILSFASTATSTTSHVNITPNTAKITQLCLKHCLWSSASFY